MYVEKRKVKGKEYLYLKASARKGDKVKSKTIAYLGKVPMTRKQINEKISKIPNTKLKSAKKELQDSFEDVNTKFLTKDQIKKLEELKKEFTKKLKTLPKPLVEDMLKDFKVYYIYNTNSIEGNTLTLKETNLLLNDNITPEGKDLKEVYDHINEKIVFDYIFKDKPEISEELIIKLHSMLLDKIDKRVGAFRSHNVRVLGADFTPTEARYVKADMKILLEWYRKNKRKLHPLILSAIFHEKFERIHPFYDGNGRTGRMLINLILLRNNSTPIVIKSKDRGKYYDVLSAGHKADLTKTSAEFYRDIVLFCYNQLVKTQKEIFSKWGGCSL